MSGIKTFASFEAPHQRDGIFFKSMQWSIDPMAIYNIQVTILKSGYPIGMIFASM